MARETWSAVMSTSQSSSKIDWTFRVETPLTYISATAIFSARSLRDPRSRLFG